MKIKASKMTSFNGGHMSLFWRQKEFLDAMEEFLESIRKT